ncbi:MAG: Gfo/Idh/MocA family oxidoreductase, partial [Armatimonadetes bacterium]|nr:Gfo/Idh/MocA family oxidoreductase [Armatimonadota bacterium]
MRVITVPTAHRVVVCGLVHDHVWGELTDWAECPGVEVVAAADPNEELRNRAADKGVRELYEDWREMADACEFDIALVYTANSDAVEVVETLAPRGVSFVVEKPMAASLDQARRMIAATEAAGVTLMVNWPIAWRGALHEAFRRVQAGDIGQPFFMNVYMGHAGPKEIGCSEYFYGWLYDAEKNGAGALMDYCCYGAAVSVWWFGKPQAVQAVAARLVKDYLTVEDNAVITMLYPDKFVEAQASWTTVPGHHDLIVRGDEGTLWTSDNYTRLFLAKTHDGAEELEVPPLPAEKSSAALYFT